MSQKPPMKYKSIDKRKGQLFGRKDIKLSFLSKEYEINSKTGETKCTLRCKLNLSNLENHFKPSKRILHTICEGYLNVCASYMGGTLIGRDPVESFSVSASVTPREGDTYDEETGKLLSEARAKEKAYNIAHNVCRRIAKMFRQVAVSFSGYAGDFYRHSTSECKRYKRIGGITDGKPCGYEDFFDEASRTIK